MKNRLPWRLLIVLGAVFALSGCSDSSISSRDIDTPTYLFYAAIGTRQNLPTPPFPLTTADPDYQRFLLYAVDPSNPSNPQPLQAPQTGGAFLPTYFTKGDVNITTRTISDIHYAYIVSSTIPTTGTGGILVRISAERSQGLFKTQLSSETNAELICANDLLGGNKNNWAFSNYATAENSVFIYRKDPDGTNCGFDNSVPDPNPANDTMNLVLLSTSSTTAPVSTLIANAEKAIAPVYNPDGSIGSVLFYASGSGGQILRYSLTDLTNPAAIVATSVGATPPNLLGIGSSGEILLTSGASVRKYNPVTDSISLPLATGTISRFATADDTHFYFRVGNIIYRMPYSATSPADVTTVIDDSAGTGTIQAYWTSFSRIYVQDMRISGNRLVYFYDDSSGASPGVEIRSVPVSGGIPTTIHTLPANSEVYNYRAAAGRVYVSMASTNDAISVGDTGSNLQVFPDSRWMAFTYHSTARMFGDFNRSGRDMRPKSMFRIEIPTNGAVRLISYDADTTAQLVDFGSPAGDFGAFLFGPADVLGLTTSENTLMAFNNELGGTDILYTHARNSSSMVRVTNNGDQYGTFLIGLNNNNGGCSFGRGAFDPVFPLLLMLSALYLWRRRSSWASLHQRTNS